MPTLKIPLEILIIREREQNYIDKNSLPKWKLLSN